MLPTAWPYDRRKLLRAWRRFTWRGMVASEGLDPAVLRSWQRCWAAGLSPTASWLAAARAAGAPRAEWLQAHADLIAVARPFMEDIYQFAGERDLLVVLTDERLCVLTTVGDPELYNRLGAIGLWQGEPLTEERVGSNALALALSEGIPVQVVGPEHYCLALHTLTDTAAPIHTPTGASAVLAIVTPEKLGHPHTLGIVMAAARAIESQLRADLGLAEALHHLSELDIALGAMSKGIIFLDPEGRVTRINPQAGEILGIRHRLAMGRPIGSVVQLPAEVEISLVGRRALAEKEVTFLARGKPRPCLLNIDVLWDSEQLQGFVFIMEQTANVRRLVHRMVGAQAHFTFEDIVAQDAEMRRVLRYARMAARDNASVLLLGESGTGKEMLAQAIHNASRRAAGPFIALNCAAIPRRLVASELFGYEVAADGSEEEGRPGKFELADGGTIFLDDVDALPLDMQAGLTRVIDTREIVRLGGTRVIPLDVRVIAACSNVDLADEARQGHFRADLYYRLHVLTLTIPPLRERGDDIRLLVGHLLEKTSRSLGKTLTVAPEAAALLSAYRWPGNVRELENVLERASHLVDGDELTVEHLPRELRTATGGPGEGVVTLQEAERMAIIRAGWALHGNTGRMAEALGIGRTTLWRKLKAYNLSPASFKG